MRTGLRRALALALLAGLTGACATPELRVVSPSPQRPRPAVPSAPPAAGPAPASPSAPAPAPLGAPATLAQAPPPAAPAAPAAPTPPAGRGRQIVLNFDNADIEAVIQAVSEIAQFNYTLAPGVAGKKVTVQTSSRIPEDEVFNVLLAVLEVHGVTAVRAGNIYKIVPMAAAREKPLPTIVGTQPDPTRRDDEVITQIVPITHLPADRVAAVIRPFVQGGNVAVHGNLLLITDTAGNIARLLQIVAVLDVEVAMDELRIFPVRYADAVELGKMLNDFFAGRRARIPTPAPVPAVPRPGVPPTPGVPTPGEPERPPLIIPDKRTNVLIVSARRADMEIVTKLLGQLDVDTQANKRVFVYYVENVKAKELAVTLTEIFGKPGEAPARPEPREAPPGAPGYQPPAPAPPAPPRPAPAPIPPGPPGAEVEPGVVEGQVKIVADEPNNALIVTTFPRNWPLIEDTIRKLDRTPKQVLIEVLVAELTLDDELRLGLEWTLRTQKDITIGGQRYNVGGVSRVDVGPPSVLPTPALPPPGSTFPVNVPPVAGLAFFIFETDRFLGLLNLYANYGKVNILSSPHILTSENKKAVINVSRSIPIPTQQLTTPTTQAGQQPQPSAQFIQNIEYRDAGIVLTVTPRISDKRVVALEVKQTVNDVGPGLVVGGLESPTIIKREAETSVVLHDNQTLVLGGLIQTRRSEARVGIPGLARIPIIGFLFGRTVQEFSRTELLILITPRVVGDPTEARELYEQIRAQRPDLQRELRTHPSILKPEAGEPSALPQPEAPAPGPSTPPREGGLPSDR